MEEALKHFPEGVTWTDAEGGMFVWATCQKDWTQ